MSQSVITKAFEKLKAQQAANGAIVTLDEFVFANVPGLSITDPINREEALPDASQIVFRQTVSKTGMVNNNAVVYSVVLGADTGDFEFNWVGLVHRETNTVAMIVHAPLQKKIRTATGQQGNVLTRSFLMEYDGASQQTQIITPADTWQIDFTARLDAVDERMRKENIDVWGEAGFIDDAFLVEKDGDAFRVNSGLAYVAGIRAELLAPQYLVKPAEKTTVWVDTCWQGTLTSEWLDKTKVTVAKELNNYVIGEERHYVCAIADIYTDGTVVDLRPKGNQTERKLELQGPLKALGNISPEAESLLWFNSEKQLDQTYVSEFVLGLLKQNSREEFLLQLGLQDLPFIAKYGAPMVGELVEWPLEKMPHEIWPEMTMEFIPYMGQSFDPSKYPLLSQVHPSNVLPADMRGGFVRGWDNGRGFDINRKLMSYQDDASQKITGTFKTRAAKLDGGGVLVDAYGGFSLASQTGGKYVDMNGASTSSNCDVITFDSSRIARTAEETRPKNVAWNMIVRAK